MVAVEAEELTFASCQIDDIGADGLVAPDE